MCSAFGIKNKNTNYGDISQRERGRQNAHTKLSMPKKANEANWTKFVYTHKLFIIIMITLSVCNNFQIRRWLSHHQRIPSQQMLRLFECIQCNCIQSIWYANWTSRKGIISARWEHLISPFQFECFKICVEMAEKKKKDIWKIKIDNLFSNDYNLASEWMGVSL